MENINEEMITIKASKRYKDILRELRKHTDIINEREGYAWGNIKGCKFRLFQEINNRKLSAYMVIKDETAKGHLWPAFYTPEDLKEWVDKRNNRNDANT